MFDGDWMLGAVTRGRVLNPREYPRRSTMVEGVGRSDGLTSTSDDDDTVGLATLWLVA